MFHISDCKKYNRCPRLFMLEQLTEHENNLPYVRLDEEVTVLAAEKLGIEKYFLGSRGDAKEKAIEATKEYDWLLKARFEYKNLRVKVPFLHKLNEEEWEVYFLYVGLYPHAFDMEYYCDTVWVLQGNGFKIKDIHLIHLNPDYVRGEQLDVDQLFLMSDYFYNSNNNPTTLAIDAVRHSYRDIHSLLKKMQDLMDTQYVPKAVRTVKCTGRQKCKYYHSCFPNDVEEKDNSILHLIASRYKYEMKNMGLLTLKEADEEKIEGTKQQYAQIMADTLGGLYVDKLALKSWLNTVHYPIAFLDFEWERFAIPPYKGMKPYDVLPFEYSLRILEEDGSTKEFVFLSIQDDRKEMVESLLQHIPKTGSIMAYNATGAERIRIQEFADQFPEYRDSLLQMNQRMVDLQIPFETGTIYDVRMRGQWSLKVIMSILEEKSYQKLDIHDGMNAVFAWRHLDYREENIDKEAIISNLKEYCAMDTYAMLVVYRWLLSLARK